MLSFLLITSGISFVLPIKLGATMEAGPVEQTLLLQITAIVILNAVLIFSKRATDNFKFPPLLLVVYFQADFYQLALLLSIDDLRSSTFWIILLLSEVSSTMKNCGLLQCLAFVVGFRKKNPLLEKSFIGSLKRRIAVDALSEILVGGSALMFYTTEKKMRKHPGAGLWNVTILANEEMGLAESYYFTTKECTITCIGWSVSDGIPPPQDIQSESRTFVILAIIMFVRLSCLLIERTVIDKLVSIFRKNPAAVGPSAEISSDSELSSDGENPVNEGSNKNTSSFQCSQSVTTQIAIVHNAAVSVFQDVSASFLFLTFLTALGSCWLGLIVITFTTTVEGVSVTYIR